MIKSGLTRRRALRAAAALGSFAIIGPARAAKSFTPSNSLLEAARKEGKITLYTATFVEVEQEVVNEFRKKFPFIRIEMIRAPGGQQFPGVAPVHEYVRQRAVFTIADDVAEGRLQKMSKFSLGHFS